MADIANRKKEEKEKKTGRKLKRSVRKTMGALFLASAIVVAAIPTDGLRAAETNSGVETQADEIYQSSLRWDASKSKIPLVKEEEENIYTDADGIFNFAWVNESETSANRVAVILGYTGKTLDNNELVIDGKVDAYAKYQSNDSSNGGYVAVSQSREPLYYMSVERKVDKTHIEEEKDETTGNVINKTEVIDSYTMPSFSPCVKEDASWDRKGSMETYYYYRYNGTQAEYEAKYSDDSADALIKPETTKESTLTSSGAFLGSDGYVYIQTKQQEHQWIRQQTVAYIGNQYLVQYKDSDAASTNGSKVVREYKVAKYEANTDPTKGVFAYQSNIQKLTVGKDLIGIGNYAFYNCALLSYVKFGNGLQEVGKSAFKLCTNMYGVGFDFGSNLTYISDEAFAFSGLQTFTLPVGVTQIYDHAFEGCTRLVSIDLTGETQEPELNPGTGQLVPQVTTLNQLGCSVFKDCTSLTEIKFPAAMKTAVHLDNFENCKLKHILVMDNLASFVPHDSTDTIKKFKKQLAEEFYFEAADSSSTHTFASDNGIAFKYSDQDLYELVVIKSTADGDSENSKVRYQITPGTNGEGILSNFLIMDGEVTNVEIPEKIGPYGISALNEGSFSGNCSLEKITIPASVRRINSNAFKGCHNLKHVIFTAAENITEIEDGAFATQVVTNHSAGCNDKVNEFLNKTPTLTFTGTIGTGIKPFDHAMSEAGKINAGKQPLTYITYYSGWPQNLEIRYVDPDPMTPGDGVATLVDYPARSRLGQYTSANYPYITADLQNAATDAFGHYGDWLENKGTSVNENEWAIINAVLNPTIPQGVKAVAEGLFNGAEVTKNEDGTYEVNRSKDADANLETITFADLAEYTPYMFDGCTALTTINIKGGDAKIDEYAFALKNEVEGGKEYSLSTVNMTDGGSAIGNYAFENNPKLTNVTISPKVTSLGLRPFKDCSKLENVNFSGGPYFTCESGVIFGLNNGSKDSVAECLEFKSGTLSSSLFTGVKSMAEEAFMNCDSLRKVDLSTSNIAVIPVDAFNGTGEVTVMLPATCKRIEERAFHNSKLWSIEIPASVTLIKDKAFDTPANPADDGTYVDPLEFVTSVDAEAANDYADSYSKDEGRGNIQRVDTPSVRTYTVEFMAGGEDGGFWKDFIEKQVVNAGSSARIPELTPVREGYSFVTWYLSPTGPDISNVDMTDIQGDMTFVPRWRVLSTSESTTTVRFIDYNDQVLSTQSVRPGDDAIQPVSPAREGYTFTGWRPGLNNIPERPEGQTYDVYAQYEKNAGGNGTTPGDGTNPGGTTPGGTPPGGTTPGGTTPGGTTPGTLYVLTVQNGSGSGSYQAGTQPVIIANDPASGQEFSHWTIDPAGTTIASTVLSATVITMPAGNVTVTAHFKAKTGTSTGTGNSSTTNSNRPSGGNTGIVSNGTTVVIDKNGLSNTGVVSATVKGSSDNFTIKITEDSAATEAVLRALMAEYGNDLSRIKYFPMDISLYDASGTRKITDTQGLLINITLPLPDSLIPYAGNNKVACVVNDRLDRLGCKFTTIDGVSCVTFTAEHFSPYVIYVDTGNLIEGMVADTTPKTGDGIHPKWFLSMGLASMSMVMFMQKDNKKKKEKVKVRA